MSKRKLSQLVEEQYVTGWDDPRMPTISGLRRRGYTPASIHKFCALIGIAKRDHIINIALLEFCIREDLNKIAWRRMAVLDPVKVTITNYPHGQTELLRGANNPEADDGAGFRLIPFSRELWIEREDFMENPPPKFFRLAPGLKVRLKHAYIIQCDHFTKDRQGTITEIHCSYFPASKSGQDTSNISVKGTIHWVSMPHAKTAEVRVYDRLFQVEDPNSTTGSFKDSINKHNLAIGTAYIEDDLAKAVKGRHYQFIRKGYFYLDKDTTPDKLIFNQTVTLKDTWARNK